MNEVNQKKEVLACKNKEEMSLSLVIIKAT